MTLSQYAAQPTNFFPPNTTILMLPGNHSLSSPLTITNILLLEMVTNTTPPQLETRVLCGSSARLQLTTITEVYISGLQFIGCTGNTLTSVEEFVLENVIFQQGEYSYGTLLTLREVIEASIVASTFTGGTQAITIVHSNITLNNSIFSNSIFQSNGGIYVSESVLVIEGCSFLNNTVRNGYSGTVYAHYSTVTIKSTEFINNSASNGGAVNTYNSYILIEDSMFIGNKAGSNGGVFYAQRRSIFIANSTFSDNLAGYSGGVIYTGDNVTITITSSTFNSNRANASDGGAVYAYNSNMTISNGTFTNNTAGSEGGAICLRRSSIIADHSTFNNNTAFEDGGAMDASESTMAIVTNTIFSNNTANSEDGGGVRIRNGIVAMINNTFSSNRAGRDGGSVDLEDLDGEVIIANNTFGNNTAGRHGGAVMCDECNVTLTFNLFQNNIVVSDGGAIHLWRSSINVDHSIFNNNTALEDGGAIYTSESTVAIVTNTIFSNNTANSEDGGGVRIRNGIVAMINNTFSSNRAGRDGGSVDLEDLDGEVIIANNTFGNNTAGRHGGAVMCDECNVTLTFNLFQNNIVVSDGGAIHLWRSSINVDHSIFNNNTALEDGGAIYTSESTVAIVTNTIFSNNTANSEDGGGVRIRNGIVAMINNIFIGNRAGRDGGAVDLDQLEDEVMIANGMFGNINIPGRRNGTNETWQHPSILKNITFINNVAVRNGGGVTSSESGLNIVNCRFSSNMAGRDGGSAGLYEGTFSITNSSFSNSTAWRYGGAVDVWNSTITITNTTFNSNNATYYDGGGIDVSESIISIANSSFSGNRASSEGGAVDVWNSVVSITNGHFSNNTAGHSGGGLRTSECSLCFEYIIFDANTAGSYGGAVYTLRTFLTADNSSFINNTAGLSGGAFTNYHGTAIVSSSTFTSNTGLTSGGSVSISNSTTNITNSTFTYDVANTDGGVLISWDSTVVINDCEFGRNTAHRSGGVLYLSDSVINVKSSIFTHNAVLIQDSGAPDASASNRNGGVMNVIGTDVTVNHCTFVSNAVHGDGGVMETEDSTINITNSVFSNNTASHVGGVFKSRSSTTVIDRGVLQDDESSRLIIYNSSFDNNSANNQGGIIGSYHTHLSMVTCSVNSNMASQGAAIHAEYSTVTVHNTTCSSNRAHIGGVMTLFKSTTTISGTNIINNTASNDAGAIHADNSTINLTNMIFALNDAFGGAGVIHGITSSLTSWGFLVIRQNRGNTGVVNVEMSRATIGGFLTFESNYRSFFILRSTVTFSGESVFMNNTKYALKNTSEFTEGGALTLYHSTVEFTDITTMMHNQAESGGAIAAFFSIINLQGDTSLKHNTATSSGGAIYAYKTEFNVRDKANVTHNIAREKGGGMHATNTTTTVSARGVLSFRENDAKMGGGVYLEEYSKLHIVKQQAEYLGRENPKLWEKLVFISNNATYGGAIYVSDRTIPETCSSNPFGTSSQECFIQTLALHSSSSHDLNTVNTYFLNNLARMSSSALYGGLLDRCTVNPSAEIFLKIRNTTLLDGLTYIQNVTNINLSSIASDPVRLCFCKNGQPDCSYQPHTVYINSEGNSSLSVVAVDQVNTAIPASITSYLTFQIPGEEFSQNVTDSCTNLDFSFLHSSARLLLFPDGPCNNLGISERFVDIVSLSCYCPIGFQPSTSGAGCVCICDLYPYITNCTLETQSVLREGDFWVTFTNNSIPNGYIIHPHCPYDYCLPPTTPVHINFNIPMGANAQCAYNRSGILCGSCKSGLSSTFGSSQCTHCSNQWLLLLIPFALCGIALLAFLLVCNFTVDHGTINGIILYADIVNTYSASFYPFQKPAVLSVFIAWLSLDFGIESCFYNGMDAYAKTWLQLAFPLYIIILAAILSAISHFSETLTRYRTNNLIPLMATVLLLSCTKFFRVMLTAFSVTQLDYPDGSHELVWLMDPSITYLKGKHIPLFVVGLLIGLLGTAYSLLLFFGHWILQWPNIRQNRVMTLLDAYYAPFTQKNSYWLGLLLLVRLLLFIVSAANLLGDPRVNLVSIITILVLVLTLKMIVTGRIYKKWQVDTLETCLIVNLALFASFTFYATDTNGNQAAVAYISTGVATVTFILYNIYMSICRIPRLREMFLRIRFQREQIEMDPLN